MAITYNNLAQAQAAYDTIRQQKERLQRNDYIMRKQNEMAVNNFLKQNGYNDGRAETFFLRNLGNRTDTSSYDAQLVDLASIISGFRSRMRGRGGYRPPSSTTPDLSALGSVNNTRLQNNPYTIGIGNTALGNRSRTYSGMK